MIRMSPTHTHFIRGFSLMELLVAMAVLGIVGAIAVPSYIGQITKSRRADAKVVLADTAQRLERCFSEANTYLHNSATLAKTCPQDSDLSDESNYYDFDIDITSGGTNYTIIATAKDTQLNRDDNCKTLSLNKINEKKSTNSSGAGSTKCW